MCCQACNELINGFYGFTDFAAATGLKAPFVGKAYNDFKTYTSNLMHEEQSFDFDGVITEAFERWCKDQIDYDLT